MKRNYFGKCLPVFVMVCIVFCFVFYGVRVDASAPDARYNHILYENYKMGTIFDAKGNVIAYGTEVGEETYAEGLETAFEPLIGLNVDNEIGPHYTVKGKFMKTLYGGKQNRMKLLNPFQKKIGSDIKLTIDSNLQCYVSEMLEAENFGGNGCLVMNYKTGEVICAVGDCFRTRKMIGSTMKPILYASILEENPLLAERNYICNVNTHKFEDVYIQCYGNVFHGTLDMKKALTVSCNGAAVAYSKQIDETVLRQNLQKFGFDTTLSYPNNYLSFADNSYWGADTEDVDEKLKVMSAIGGGNCSASPASLAVSYSALFNDGVAVAPYIVSEASEYHGDEFVEIKKNDAAQMCSKETASKILDMMINVVDQGTAKGLAMEDVKIAAKTGTANYDTETNVLWLVAGMLEEEAPYLIVSYADQVPNYLDSSSTLGATTKQIMKYILGEVNANESTEEVGTDSNAE